MSWRMCFFFKAEGGIGNVAVTGVQTCALTILTPSGSHAGSASTAGERGERLPTASQSGAPVKRIGQRRRVDGPAQKIGRASCRGRVEVSVVAVALNKKRVVWGDSRVHNTRQAD